MKQRDWFRDGRWLRDAEADPRAATAPSYVGFTRSWGSFARARQNAQTMLSEFALEVLGLGEFAARREPRRRDWMIFAHDRTVRGVSRLFGEGRAAEIWGEAEVRDILGRG